ncbi:hypothetical protein JWG44_15315 [Leptospira sp. 201903071]|uniref:hypothetical protein n=1 Tax=Leptospira ainazelensis TaxID=2810034 RepID=UPI0019667CFF|nr:hypothetical protein [Leptospira ainazelensis]MBM9501622.1 hypothetical protein [Leptospira ainazelensis]
MKSFVKSMRTLGFFLIFANFIQSCDFDTEVSIPKEIIVSNLESGRDQTNHGPRGTTIYSKDTIVWNWIEREISKFRSGWRSYYATLPSRGILIDLDQGRSLLILDHVILYKTRDTVLYHEFQKEKFLQLQQLIIETGEK